MAFGILVDVRVCGIYKIKNTSNGKFYIGSSFSIKTRLDQHVTRLRRGAHINRHLQSAFCKYGEDVFIAEVLECCDRPDVLEREQHYIDTLAPTYNICRTAGATVGYRHTEESRLKMSVAMGKREPIFKGCKHTDESLTKMREAKIGKRHTPDQSEKHRTSMMGRKHALGNKFTQEQIEKVRAASLSKWADPVWKAAQCERIAEGKKRANAIKAI